MRKPPRTSQKHICSHEVKRSYQNLDRSKRDTFCCCNRTAALRFFLIDIFSFSCYILWTKYYEQNMSYFSLSKKVSLVMLLLYELYLQKMPKLNPTWNLNLWFKCDFFSVQQKYRSVETRCSKCCTIPTSPTTRQCQSMKTSRPAGLTLSTTSSSTIVWFLPAQQDHILVRWTSEHVPLLVCLHYVLQLYIIQSKVLNLCPTRQV